MLTVSFIWGLVVAICCFFWLILSIRRRQPGEPPLENGLIPYLGCALQFGANPLEFLRTRENKYGNIFTCKIAGQFVHFVTDPFSFSSVMRHGRHFDWQKFHYATSEKVFGHKSLDAAHGSTDESVHELFMKTMQGDALNPLVSNMMENLQYTMLQVNERDWRSEGLYAFCYRIMFEAGYMTLFGKEFAQDDKNFARKEAQRALILNAIENFKEFDKIFPALVAGLPIHVFKSAYSARENLARDLLHENLRKRNNISGLIARRMLLNETTTASNDMEKAKTHLALLWASQANTLPATFWSLFYLLRCPDAMKAAGEEVHQVLEKASQKVSFDGKYIFLNRHELDEMPVLGMTTFSWV
ncbi:hypothetical protein GDO86_010990 [Hymenochirus boettgeri]|uniref:Cholesterol 7-alpha-monooxygenase n=1 Tax=Hymenochirus boettgeri TaxID=247094 RepID=A0A8T2JEN4_9PIPI|nr:hypothetical protein GDO86_010990 [Hymenochirus boettgeri]